MSLDSIIILPISVRSAAYKTVTKDVLKIKEIKHRLALARLGGADTSGLAALRDSDHQPGVVRAPEREAPDLPGACSREHIPNLPL